MHYSDDDDLWFYHIGQYYAGDDNINGFDCCLFKVLCDFLLFVFKSGVSQRGVNLMRNSCKTHLWVKQINFRRFFPWYLFSYSVVLGDDAFPKILFHYNDNSTGPPNNLLPLNDTGSCGSFWCSHANGE